jgi:hypothetical protein
MVRTGRLRLKCLCADGVFAVSLDYTGGKQPFALALGDLNGDESLDIVTVNLALDSTSIDTVSVLLGRGDGTLTSKRDFVTASGPTSLALGDLNGDGKLDIVTTSGASFDKGRVNVLFGKGDGTFSATTSFDALAAGLSAHPDLQRTEMQIFALTSHLTGRSTLTKVAWSVFRNSRSRFFEISTESESEDMFMMKMLCLGSILGLAATLGSNAFAANGATFVPGMSCRTSDNVGNALADHFSYTAIYTPSGGTNVYFVCPLTAQDTSQSNIVNVEVLGNTVKMNCTYTTGSGPFDSAQGGGVSHANYAPSSVYQNAVGDWVYIWQTGSAPYTAYVWCQAPSASSALYYVSYTHS